MTLLAIEKGESVDDAITKAWVSRFVIIGILSVFGLTYFMVGKALDRIQTKVYYK